MLGAIIGDIVGSAYEFNSTNDYNFEMFRDGSKFTDDTICTVAIADALLKGRDYGESLHEWCRRYMGPKGGYGGRFRKWVESDEPRPYGSYGNGSAMRVSPIAWAYLKLGEALREAEKSAECTHNHPEGIKGAQATVAAIHYGDELRRLSDKIDKETITKAFQPIIEQTGYNININKRDVMNKFDETCQGMVPVALWVITESTGFEDAIRKAVSLGADADTLGAIVGSIAEAIWGIPTDMALEAMRLLPNEMKSVVLRFYSEYDMIADSPLRGYGDEGAAEDLSVEEEMEQKEQMKAIMHWKLGLGHMGNFFAGRDSLPEKRIKATADSWETEPMPDNDDVSTVEVRIDLNPEQMIILALGHTPEAQEDHWFMYCDDEYIRYYRSWTGMCAFEAHYHEEDHHFVIDSIKMNHGLCEFGVNGDEAGIALFRYLIIAEIGYNAEEAWQTYLTAWEHLYDKYSKKPTNKSVIRKVADSWFTGTKGKVCDGCIYCGGIRRGNDDSPSSELMGCGRCGRATFKDSYMSGKCKFRKTSLWEPSEFELEAKHAEAERKRKLLEKERVVREMASSSKLMMSCVVAGTQFIEDQHLFYKFGVYDMLTLKHEVNKYDDNAVAICYKDDKIGYVPRKQNAEIASLLKCGWDKMFQVVVTDWQGHGEKRRITVEIYVRPMQEVMNEEDFHKSSFEFDKKAYMAYHSAEDAQLYFSTGGSTGTLAGRMTPAKIEKLREGEIFVFGSNAMGHHAGGAAHTAMQKFGAIWGQGDGLQGQSYAISTMEGLVNTARNVNRFIRFAAEHQEYKFLVTPIGCGIAGYTPLQMAPLLRKAIMLPNVYLPKVFWEYYWMTEEHHPDYFQPSKDWEKWI